MNRRRTLVFLLTTVLLFSSALSASAFYQWVDEKGNLHITDNPPPSKQPREEPEAAHTPKVPPPVLAPAQPQPLPPATPAPALRPAAAAQQSSPSQTALQTIPVPAPAAPTAPAPAMPAVKEAPRGNVPSPFLPKSAPDAKFLPAILAGFMTVFLFIAVGMYVFFSLCLYLIAKKLNVAEAWAAWIPIIQIWPFLSSAGKPCWWVILLFIPFVNVIVSVYLWICIAENLGRNKWLGLLMLLPIVNIVFMGSLAFSKEDTGQQTAGT